MKILSLCHKVILSKKTLIKNVTFGFFMPTSVARFCKILKYFGNFKCLFCLGPVWTYLLWQKIKLFAQGSLLHITKIKNIILPSGHTETGLYHDFAKSFGHFSKLFNLFRHFRWWSRKFINRPKNIVDITIYFTSTSLVYLKNMEALNGFHFEDLHVFFFSSSWLTTPIQ